MFSYDLFIITYIIEGGIFVFASLLLVWPIPSFPVSTYFIYDKQLKGNVTLSKERM